MKMKKRLDRYDINRPKSRYGNKYSKYKKCLSMMMLLCIKENLSNIWSWIYEKVKNTEAELKKSIAYKKKVYFSVLTKFVGIPQLLKDVIRDNKKDTKITPGVHCY